LRSAQLLLEDSRLLTGNVAQTQIRISMTKRMGGVIAVSVVLATHSLVFAAFSCGASAVHPVPTGTSEVIAADEHISPVVTFNFLPFSALRVSAPQNLRNLTLQCLVY